MTRRDFVRAGAVVTGTFMTSFSLFVNHNKIKLAILGTGNWGTQVLLKSAHASGHFDVVALCDVNPVALQRASTVAVALSSSKVKLFSDYREMYAMKGLD